MRLLSPDYLSLHRFISQKDISLIHNFYSKYKILENNYLDFRREIDMTNDKDLFYEKKEYQEGMIKLYEGKMIWQYDSKFSNPQYFLKIDEVKERLKSKEIYRLSQDVSIAEEELKNRLQINSLENFISYDYNYYRLGFRAISNSSMERSLIASLIPKNIFAGNSLFLSIPKKYYFDDNSRNIFTKEIDIEVLLFINSLFNSIVIDYILRLMIKYNVNKTYIYRLPLPQPSKEEIYSNEIYKKLMSNSLKLTLHYNYNDFEELAQKFNINKEDIPITEKQVDLLKIENDILVAKLYDLSSEDLKHICSYFKVLLKNKPEYISSLLSEYDIK